MRAGDAQAGARPAGAVGAGAGRDRARAGRARRRRPAGRVVLPGPPGELQPMWAEARWRPRPCARARARGHVEQRIMRAVRGAGVRARADCCARLRLDARRASRSRPACGAASSRSRPCSRRAAGRLRRVRGGACVERHGDDACSRATGRRSTRSSRGCCSGRRCDGGGRRVVHRRADGGAADRPAGLVGVRAGRRRRRTRTRRRWRTPACRPALIERDGAVSPEVADALADGRRGAVRRPTSASASPASPARAAGRRRSRSGWSASAWRGAAGDADRADAAAAGRPRDGPRPHDHRGDAPAAAAAARGRSGRGGVTRRRAARSAPVRRARAARGGPRRAGRVPRRGGGPGRLAAGRRPRRCTSRSRSSAAARRAMSPAIDEVLRRARPARRRGSRSARRCCSRRAAPACCAPARGSGRHARRRSRRASSDGLAAAGRLHAREAPVPRPRHRRPPAPARAAPRSVDVAPEPLEFVGEALTLFVSRLHPHGARYEPLVRLETALTRDASRHASRETCPVPSVLPSNAVEFRPMQTQTR